MLCGHATFSNSASHTWSTIPSKIRDFSLIIYKKILILSMSILIICKDVQTLRFVYAFLVMHLICFKINLPIGTRNRN